MDETRTKRCGRCEITLSTGHFGKNKRAKDGLQTYCRGCMSKMAAEWRAKNPEYQRKWKEANPEAQTVYRLTHKFGIGIAQYNRMLVSQGGVCAICGSEAGERMLAVDHDHRCCPGDRTCGSCVRGLLCHGCNVTLGIVRDDVDRLMAMVRYLSRIDACVVQGSSHSTDRPSSHRP